MPVQCLSESFLDKLKTPPERDVIYWDTLVPGFAVKHCAHTGTKSYLYRYDVYVTEDGRRKRKEKRPVISNSSRMTLEDARNEARRRLTAIKDGIQVVNARQQLSVGELADKWENSVAGKEAAKKPSWKDTRSELKRVRTALGFLRLNEISRDQVRNWHEANGKTPVMANAVIKRLRALWMWGEAEDLVPASAPSSIKLFGKFSFYPERGRKKVFKEETLFAYLQAIDRHVAVGDPPALPLLALKLLAYSGGRKSEILGLRYDRGDEHNYVGSMTIVLNRHKSFARTGVPEIKAITPEIADVLAEIRRHCVPGSEFLFPSPRKVAKPRSDLKTHHRAILKEIGITDPGSDAWLTIHDLRRTWISIGGNDPSAKALEAVSEAVGHGDVSTTVKHYYVEDDEKRRATTARITGKIKQIATGGRKRLQTAA
jgi:integrase